MSEWAKQQACWNGMKGRTLNYGDDFETCLTLVDTAKAGWESVSGAFASAYEGLKSLPGIGPAIKAAEAGARKIAGITNERGNVVGLMPHPEHNMEELTSPSLDGRAFFASLERFLAAVVG